MENQSAPSSDKLVFDLLKERACMKQDVYANARKTFATFRETLERRTDELQKEIEGVDERVNVEFSQKGDFACEVGIAGDRLVFTMHTNVFKIEESSSLWRSSYLREDELRGYCGIINVYNFLNDSFKYNRYGDAGYLIARIFVNREGHFFVQGKRQLGFLYNDFINAQLDEAKIKEIVNSILVYTLNFDLLTPPYDHVKEVRVAEILEWNSNMGVSTGKRLGFRFQADSDAVE